MKKRIFCDTTLFMAAIVLLSVSSLAVIATMFIIVNENTVVDPADVATIRIFFGALELGLWLAIILSSPRFLCMLTLSPTSITVWIPFQKSDSFSYDQFRFIACGGYFHGNIAGIGRNIWYIVIAQRRLSARELNAINHVPNSKEVIKIRCTPKTVKQLRRILPAKQMQQIDVAIAKVTVN